MLAGEKKKEDEMIRLRLKESFMSKGATLGIADTLPVSAGISWPVSAPEFCGLIVAATAENRRSVCHG